MLYLAKVQKSDATNSTSLMLLACQSSESSWSLLSPSDSGREGELVVAAQTIDCPDDGFVLVSCTEDGSVEKVEDATAWILMVIEQYLSKGITPEILMAESEHAEEWRQSLTLKSQDVVRRSLEVETRRDQIQELEKGLEDKRAKLDAKEEEIEGLKHNLDQIQTTLDKQQELLIAEQKKLEIDQQLLQAQQAECLHKQEALQKEAERLTALREQMGIQSPDPLSNLLEFK